MRCKRCRGALEMIQDNGVTDPDETRTETHQCVECGLHRHITLTA
jgi:hypothetical protein